MKTPTSDNRDAEIQESGSRHEYVADVAAKWADHRFCTEDGRRFACVKDSDSILARAQTLGLFLTWSETALLERGSLAGAIVELGCSEPPMLYGTLDALTSHWLALHESFNVPLTEEEAASFDVPFYSDLQESRDDEDGDTENSDDREF